MKFNSAFRKWFGDSKVVDSKGEPLVVYHGTASIRTKFDTSKCQLGCHFGTKDQADYFISDGGVLTTHYLSIQNPLRLRDEPSWSADGILEQYLPPRVYYWSQNTPSVKGDTGLRYQWTRKVLMSSGYDGVVYLNRIEGLSSSDDARMDNSDIFHWQYVVSDAEFKKSFPSARDSWIVFSPTQIKSATGNDGTWDADDPDIRSNPGLEDLECRAEKIISDLEK